MKTFIRTHDEKRTPYWWMSALTGVSYILIGALLLIIPFGSNFQLTEFFATVLLISALFEINFIISNKSKIFSWGFNLINTVYDLLMSAILVFSNELGRYFIIYFSGFWLLSKSISSLNLGLHLKKTSFLKVMSILTSIVALVCSMFLIINELFSFLEIRGIIGVGLLSMGLSRLFDFKLQDKERY
ncbi:hypothetical protein EI427_12715 [Flammeovirga pectinis]|uniref:HdeD family acid-resistance protein n=1 Tax=Flammeovirga pectinis TaxID=2494373 RepID=A0A3Q9FRH7_9BACT|nr:hypothetical protein [Flammeovirga pectinis]AZQ63067.1 hypothetical protein EI427_12715 [Flammeovirga pectinis]